VIWWRASLCAHSLSQVRGDECFQPTVLNMLSKLPCWQQESPLTPGQVARTVSMKIRRRAWLRLREALVSWRSMLPGACHHRTARGCPAVGACRYARPYSPWSAAVWEERRSAIRVHAKTLALIAYRQRDPRGEKLKKWRGVAVEAADRQRRCLSVRWVRVVGHRDVPGDLPCMPPQRQFLGSFQLAQASSELLPFGANSRPGSGAELALHG